MHFYVQPLEPRAESTLLELMFQNDLSDCYHRVSLAGTEDIDDAYRVTPEVLFRFVRSERGQACNVYVKNDDGSFRSFPAYLLAMRSSLPPIEELMAMRCRAEPEPAYE